MANYTNKTTRLECPQCDFGPFTRNYYFTGKLLVERDFWDEQCFHREKLRHHHQRLHGWGVVCGLKVKQHENPACRDRFVCIEPGTAIDCCGHEILVREEECIDINQFEAIKALREQDDGDPHTLQICIRYLECPTEEIPVLYDECGCDDTRCAPNRILESYEFDMVVVPESAVKEPTNVRVDRSSTVNAANTHRFAIDEANDTIYVLTRNASAEVVAFNTSNGAFLRSYDIGARTMDIAISPDGESIYISCSVETEGLKVFLLPSSLDEDGTEISITDDGGGIDKDVHLAVAPGGRLYALNTNNNRVYAWDDPENTEVTFLGSVSVGNESSDIVVSVDGNWAFVANGGDDASISVIDATADELEIKDKIVKDKDIQFNPYTLAVADTTDGPRLYVADNDANTICIFDAVDPFTTKGDPRSLNSNTPVDLAASPGGRWLYVLVEDGEGKGHIQVVDTHRVETGEESVLGTLVPIGDNPLILKLVDAGRRAYAAYGGSSEGGGGAGVAVLSVSEQSCTDLFRQTLEPCPDCPDGNCVVLATIENYRLDDQLINLTPGDEEVEDGQAYIDNLKDRHLLPSTDLITKVVRCALERGVGGGEPGPQGQPGLRGKRGESGLGLEEGLTRINALSWIHNRTVSNLVQVNRVDNSHQKNWGVVIGFTDKIQVKGRPIPIHNDYHVFQVLVDRDLKDGLRCQYLIKGEVIPVNFQTHANAKHLIKSANEISDKNTAPGLAFIPNSKVLGQLIESSNNNLEIWVRLRGDFVLDTDGRAIDAEFVRAELATGDRPVGSNVGVQGGLFESWFTLIKSNLINVNEVDRSELIAVHGIGPSTADKILERRESRPFSSLEEVRIRARINKYNWSMIRDRITIGPGE